ncbi:MAG: hypothetical protein J5730_00095 [Bacteroidales bacterium]|nr:hypothetical protein [Bacteroidales bacterium]
MKKILSLIALAVLVFIAGSCNRGEGTGGTCTLEGTVFSVLHPDDNYNLETDTIPAAKTDVFLVYGTDKFYGDDVETDHTGFYQFKYLRPGTYTLYAYSTLPSGERIAVSQTVTIERGKTTTVPDIYIHSGKAYGTSIIKGITNATYIDKNGVVTGTGPAYEHRMYIQRQDEPYPFDDVRVGIDGVFMFQKITPGQYIVFTTSVYDEDEVPFIIQKNVSVEEAGIIVEIPEPFSVTIRP